MNDRQVQIKTPAEIESMKRAGRAVAELLDHLAPLARSGIDTLSIDRACEAFVNSRGWVAAPKGYAPPGHAPFPAHLCSSINHQVCHGIPGPKVLAPGDLAKIDCTVIVDGWHGDSCRSFICPAKGLGSVAAARLSRLTHEAMWEGIAAARAGAPINAVGAAIETFAKSHGLGIVRDFTGHGIGRAFHEAPAVRSYSEKGDNAPLLPGMCITVEPMLCLGSGRVKMLANGWTVVSADRSLCAQWEHTVAITEQGPMVLSCSPGMEPMPGRFAGRVLLNLDEVSCPTRL